MSLNTDKDSITGAWSLSDMAGEDCSLKRYARGSRVLGGAKADCALLSQDLVLANGNSALRHIVDKAEAILFLGTPHGGVERSRLGRFFCLGRLCQLVDEIGLNSDVVIDLQRDFNAAFDYRLNIVKTDFGLSSFILVGPIDSFTLQDKNRL